jgi:hypothetical protein
VDTTGGSGSNPSASETAYTTSSWFIVDLNIGDKILMYDPANPAASGITWWQGQLDPTAGEC